MNTVRLFFLIGVTLLAPAVAHAAPKVITREVPVTKGWYLTPDTRTLILASPKTAELIVFDVMTAKEDRRIAVPFKPAMITGQNSLLYVSVEGGNIVHAVDLQSGRKVREYRVPGEPIQALACHPESGPVFASNLNEEVFALSSDSTQVSKTIAKGMFLRVDPAKGKFLLTGTNRPSRDVVELTTNSRGGVDLQFVTVAEFALVVKYGINGNKLKLQAANNNTAVGFGGYLSLSPDGKKFAMVAGGGWRSASNRSTRYDIAVFDADEPGQMLGGLEAGGPQNIAFHPVLPIGVSQGTNYDFYLFDSESLVNRQQWTIKPKSVEFWQNLATFGGHGTVYIAQQGAALRFFVLDLDNAQRQALQKVYGKLPEYNDAVALEDATATAVAAVTPTQPSKEPAVSKEEMRPGKGAAGKPEVVTAKKKPGAFDRPEKGAAAKSAEEGPVRLSEGVGGMSLVVADRGVPYMSDRNYLLAKLPDELKNGSLLVRSSNQAGQWLREKSLVASQECMVYAAVMHEINGKPLMDSSFGQTLVSEGWTVEKEAFATTSADKETWTWQLISKKVPAGPIALPSKARIVRPGQVVFVFK